MLAGWARRRWLLTAGVDASHWSGCDPRRCWQPWVNLDRTHPHPCVSPFCLWLHLSPSPPGKWVLIDFGLARKYVDEDGSHMAPRSGASFRGSTAYASLHAHRNEDLSRRDDLWSWFYMLLELVEGEGGGLRGVEESLWPT